MLFGSLGIGGLALVGIVAMLFAFAGGSSSPPKKPVKKKPSPSTAKVVPPATPAMALDFDGRTAYVEVPGWRYDGSHPLTVEAWVLCRQLGGDRAIVSNTESSGLELSFLATGNDWCFSVRSGGTYTKARANSAAIALAWTHLAGVIDGPEVRLYVNGIQQRQVAQMPAGHDASTQVLLIGANPDKDNKPTKFFDGLLDEVRISKIVRYTGNFRPQRRFPPADAVTELLLRFDDGVGSIARDSTPHKRDGKIVGAKWVPAEVSAFASPTAGLNPPPTAPAATASSLHSVARSDYLDDLPETSWQGHLALGKHGQNEAGGQFRWQSGNVGHSLLTHPNDNTSARVVYDLGGHYEAFSATVACLAEHVTPLTFRVLGDGKLLWESAPQTEAKAATDLVVNVRSVKELALEVACPAPRARPRPFGSSRASFSSWKAPTC